MKVLIVCGRDWANVAYNYQESLRESGVDARAVKRSINPRRQQQAEICKLRKMKVYAKSAEIIHFMHSQLIPEIDLKGKKVVVSHTGSTYRGKYEKVNARFNPIVDLSIGCGDLYGKGAKNEYWIEGGITDTNLLQPVYERSDDKIIVSHFPSSPKTKGSNIIKKTLKNKGDAYTFTYNYNIVDWKTNIERVKKCDIYVERFKPNSGFGISALEAAALGKIVITTYAFKQKYEETHGKLGLISVTTQNQLLEEVRRISNLSDNEIIEMKKKSREWVERCHSYEAIGLKLLKLYRTIL